MLDAATALQEAALSLTEDSGQVVPSAFVERFGQVVVEEGGGGADPNAMFTAMLATNQLREIGLRPESGAPGAPWSRPALDNPAPVDGMPHGLRLVPAAVAMLWWKLEGRDR
ncbi:MAG: hypothetical protein EKK42_07525 [Pseudonocardiaceae bacterium]|nr:MAG: hypothetical protein EKK42_07525 [Pseudonocardiaceae bacterium]